MTKDVGRVASPPGSREPSPSVSAASGFDPSRDELVRFYSSLEPREIEKRIVEYDAKGIVIGRFRIHRFRDGQDIGLPTWAKHILIGGFREQVWGAYDQRQQGKMVASGGWGDSLLRLRHGRVTSKRHRYYAGVLEDALAIAMEARRAETAKLAPCVARQRGPKASPLPQYRRHPND